MKVALLGLGAMGAAMARRLETADDVELTVYNRSAAPTREFRERGVPVAPTPHEAAANAEIAICMLADGNAVEAVVLGDAGVLGGERAPGVLIDMSTIDLPASRRIAEHAAARGVAYLRAPVSGNPGVVAAGNLAILVSGDARAFERVRDVLAAIGPRLFYLGDADQARVMKLALNLMVGGTTELLAEALVLGEANGLERAQMLDVIGASAVGSPFVAYKSGPLAAEDFTSTFSAQLMHKDLRLVVECANGTGVPVPVTALVQQLVQACIGAGMGELDFSVLVPRLEREAGRRTELPALSAAAPSATPARPRPMGRSAS